MKGNRGLMIIAIAASIAFCFLNELRYALIVLVLAFWFINDYRATSKVLQPILIWVSARVFQAFFSFLMSGISDLIAAFANKWNSIDTDVLQFINPICTLWTVIFLTLAVVFFFQNKNVPLYGKFSDSVAKILHGRRNGFKDEDLEDEKPVEETVNQ